jgi:hypothetical protein
MLAMMLTPLLGRAFDQVETGITSEMDDERKMLNEIANGTGAGTSPKPASPTLSASNAIDLTPFSAEERAELLAFHLDFERAAHPSLSFFSHPVLSVDLSVACIRFRASHRVVSEPNEASLLTLPTLEFHFLVSFSQNGCHDFCRVIAHIEFKHIR